MKAHPVNTHQRVALCTDCRQRRACYRGGWCWVCHSRNAVARRAPKQEPPEPTDAEPGSADKVAVLARRAEMGVVLWHRGDKRADVE